MAISLNGMIASEAGNEDFLSHENWESFCLRAKEFGNFVVGRKTYEAVKTWNEGYSFDDLVGIEKVVMSQNKNFRLDEGYTLASSPQGALAALSDKGFDRMLVTGGADINSAFARMDLLDEVILNIESVIVGKGIPVFKSQDFELKLKLISEEKSSTGIITLRYSVLKKIFTNS